MSSSSPFERRSSADDGVIRPDPARPSEGRSSVGHEDGLRTDDVPGGDHHQIHASARTWAGHLGELSLGLWLVAFVAILGMSFAKAQGSALGMGLLFVVGLLLGMAIGPTISAYAALDSGASCCGRRVVSRRCSSARSARSAGAPRVT